MAQVTLASTSKSVVVPHKQASTWYLQYDEYYNPLIAGRISVQEYLEVVRSLNKLWDNYSKKRRILFLFSIAIHMINGLIFGALVYSSLFYFYIPVFFVVMGGMIGLSTYLGVKWFRDLQHDIKTILNDANTKLAERKIEWKLFPKWLSIEFDDPQGVTVIQMSSAPTTYQPAQYQQPQYQPPQYPPQYPAQQYQPPQYPPQYGSTQPNMYPGQAPQYPPQYPAQLYQPPQYPASSERSSLLNNANHA